MPALAAACLRIYEGQELVEPDINLGYIPNFLRMALGPESEVAKNSKVIYALETLFILQAENELSCSTAAVRHMTSALADVYTSISGAVTALFGIRTGSKNEAVLKMLEGIGSVEKVADFIECVKQKDCLLVGFGNLVYKNHDPRVSIIKQLSEQVFAVTGREDLIDVAMELERLTLNDDYFISRKLYPNIDFYSCVIYKAIGFPPEFFTVLFALPRFTGWLSHWNEFIEDPDNKIVRPRQIYMGERARNYVSIGDRLDDELAPYETTDQPNLGFQLNLPTIYSHDGGSDSVS